MVITLPGRRPRLGSNAYTLRRRQGGGSGTRGRGAGGACGTSLSAKNDPSAEVKAIGATEETGLLPESAGDDGGLPRLGRAAIMAPSAMVAPAQATQSR